LTLLLTFGLQLVLVQGMAELKRNAVARVVMHGRAQLVLIRPIEGLLNMAILNYENQVTKPAAFDEEITKPALEPEELKLAKTLIEASAPKQFDFSQYKDDYTEKLTQLIEKKVAGEEVVAPPVHEHAQVINLMMDLQSEMGLAYLVISHDIAVVERISHRVAVMYLGRIVELASTRAVFQSPQHPYTEALLSAVPVPDPTVEAGRTFRPGRGEVPSPINPPAGCVFHPRCPLAFAR